MQKIFILLILFIGCAKPALAANKSALTNTQPAKLVSINLCSDRILQALARPEQIAALSKNAFDANLYLEKPADNIKPLQANINSLLPYYGDKILIDKKYNYLLYQHLKQLGFNLIDISLPTNLDELNQLVKKIGLLTNDTDLQNKFTSEITQSYITPKTYKHNATMISEGLVIENGFVAKQLFELLGLTMTNTKSYTTKLSLENLLLLHSDYLIIARFAINSQNNNQQIGYSKATSLLKNKFFTDNDIVAARHQYTLPSKYQICFDQGIWQGAKYIKHQIDNNNVKLSSN